MNALAWLLTYALPIALIAFGSVTQGDDGPWTLSLFVFAPVASVGAVTLLLRRDRIYDYRWMGMIHILTAILAIRILPGYWSRVTIRRDHIGAGFDQSYVGVLEAASWHFWWAPVMTGLSVAIVFLAIHAMTKTKRHNKPAHPTAGSAQIEFRLPSRRGWPIRSVKK